MPPLAVHAVVSLATATDVTVTRIGRHLHADGRAGTWQTQKHTGRAVLPFGARALSRCRDSLHPVHGRPTGRAGLHCF